MILRFFCMCFPRFIKCSVVVGVIDCSLVDVLVCVGGIIVVSSSMSVNVLSILSMSVSLLMSGIAFSSSVPIRSSMSILLVRKKSHLAL